MRGTWSFFVMLLSNKPFSVWHSVKLKKKTSLSLKLEECVSYWKGAILYTGILHNVVFPNGYVGNCRRPVIYFVICRSDFHLFPSLVYSFNRHFTRKPFFLLNILTYCLGCRLFKANTFIVCLFVCLDFTSHPHSIGHLATFQLIWWSKTSGALRCIISGTNRHLSRTTDVS
jgi:hypothetical protein